jgi:hypothetical protein
LHALPLGEDLIINGDGDDERCSTINPSAWVVKDLRARRNANTVLKEAWHGCCIET